MAESRLYCFCGVMCCWPGITLLIIGTVYTTIFRGGSDFTRSFAIMGPIMLALGPVFIIIGAVLIYCYRKRQAEQITQNLNRQPVVVTAGAQPTGYTPVPVAGYGPSQSQYPSAYPAPQPTAPPVQGYPGRQQETTFIDRSKHDDDMPPPSYASVVKNS